MHRFSRIIKLWMAVVFIALLGSAFVQARNSGPDQVKPSVDTSRFRPRLGTYYYKIKWGSMEAAEAKISMEAEGDYYRIVADAKPTEFIDNIYKIRYRGEGVINADDYTAVETVFEDRTRSRQIRTEIHYHDSGEIESVTVKKKKKKPPKTKVRKFEPQGEVLDAFSAVFLALSFDWRVGLSQQFEVFTGKKNYLVTLVCVETTQVEHREKEITCWVVVPTVIDTGKPNKKPRFTKTKIYISADPSRAVLKVKTKAGIGTVKAKLKGFEPQPQTNVD